MANLFDQETVTARIEGANTVVGTIYRIVTRVTLDFTTVGAPANTVGTVFIATSVDALGAGDALSEITAPGKGIPSVDPWPALAGAEAITASNDRDLGTNIGNWTFFGDSTDSTLTYSTADVGGTDDKQLLITIDETTDACTYALAQLATSKMTLAANTLHKVSAKVQVPVGNTNKTASIRWGDITGELPANITLDLTGSENTYQTIGGYYYLAADITGFLWVGFQGNPVDGDLMYIDDISIRPVQFSWVPQGTNLMEIDETEDALHITFVSDSTGAKLTFRDAFDLSSDLVVGQSYIFQFDGKVGATDTVTVRINNGSDNSYTANIATSFTTYRMVFVAENTTNCYVSFAIMGAGEEVWIRNLSLQAPGARGLGKLGTSLSFS